jgi:hypothetical protein
VEGERRPLPRATWLVALLVPALVLAGYALRFRTFVAFAYAVDPGNAARNCRAADGGVIPFCDFANHYFPEGRRIFADAGVVKGFLYPAPFALFQGVLARFSYPVALVLWVSVVLAGVLALYLGPIGDRFGRRPRVVLLYAVLFCTSLPVLHDVHWSQVSTLVTVLPFAAFLAHRRGRRRLAAVAMAAAASVKLYPLVLSGFFLLARDRRAFLLFVAAAVAALLVIPALVLGLPGMVHFYAVWAGQLLTFEQGIADSPYSSYVANVISAPLSREVQSDSLAYVGARIGGAVLVAGHAWAFYHLVRRAVADQPYWAAALGFTAIPFFVPVCWVHYFVFLPLVQTFLAMSLADAALPARVKLGLGLGCLLPSAVVASAPFFFAGFADPRVYYRGGFPFWATALLLPPLYVLVAGRLRGGEGEAPAPGGPADEALSARAAATREP